MVGTFFTMASSNTKKSHEHWPDNQKRTIFKNKNKRKSNLPAGSGSFLVVNRRSVEEIFVKKEFESETLLLDSLITLDYPLITP